MKKIFFTGANGFIGTKLSDYLQEQDNEIEFHNYSGKIESFEELKEAFQKDKWDYIFHFAGMSHVADCEVDPQKAYEVNVLGTLFLVQLISESDFKGKFFFTSTSLVYDFDQTDNHIEINEQSALAPKNTYSRTKFYAEKIVQGLSDTSKCQVILLRLFNHTHKSQSPKFILPSVFQQISNSPDKGTIKVGNLDVARDFSLISDFNKKFLSLMKQSSTQKFQIVNLSSGVARNLRNIVKLMIEKSGKKLEIIVDPSLLRKTDPKYIVGKFASSYNSTLSDEEFVTEFMKS